MYTIWCNASLSPEAIDDLRAGTVGHRLILPDQKTGNLGTTGQSEELAEAEIAFGQPDPGQAASLPGLKWVHLTSAGYTRYDTPEFRSGLESRGAVMTNSSWVYAEPCAQHLLAFMLAQARQLPASLLAQANGPSWAYDQLRPHARVLAGDTVLILGLGAIGQRLVELLVPFGLRVMALRRRVRGDEPVPTYPMERMLELLPDADHVVNILPASPSTDGLVDADTFAAMKPGATFYNVGRGTTVDQPALIQALDSSRLGAAYLDVTDPEPLPADHPLWKAPNCYVTPHIAGGRDEETQVLVRHFLRNLALYAEGRELVDRVF